MTFSNRFRNSFVFSFKMAANKVRLTSFKLLKNYNFHNSCSVTPKYLYCTKQSDNKETSGPQKLGFVEFSEKREEFLKPKAKPEPETFVSLLRNSAFVSMGDPEGKVVIGEIYHVVGNDLYIDFGWKFPTVCVAPERKKELYIPGTKVRLLIKNLELTTKFLGSDDYVTLNEADCTLLGVASFQRGKKRYEKESKESNFQEN